MLAQLLEQNWCAPANKHAGLLVNFLVESIVNFLLKSMVTTNCVHSLVQT